MVWPSLNGWACADVVACHKDFSGKGKPLAELVSRHDIAAVWVAFCST